MNLNYTILWFDDQPHNLRETEDAIRRRVIRLGFKLNIEWVEKVDNLRALVRELRKNEDKYDLILMDWNLGSGPDGDVVARRIRAALRFTDMVFYSSAPKGDLRKAIAEQSVDGVYIIDRFRDLVEDTYTIIHRTIRRIVDVNHMRGLVMGAVADFDHAINDCIDALYSRMPENEKVNLLNKIIKKIQDTAKSRLKKAEKLEGSEFDTLMKNHDFGSNQRYEVLKSLLKVKRRELDWERPLEIFNRYLDEVLRPRNTLAHAKAEKTGDKVHFTGDGLTYDEEEMSKLRRNLIDHETNIFELLNLIMQSKEER